MQVFLILFYLHGGPYWTTLLVSTIFRISGTGNSSVIQCSACLAKHGETVCFSATNAAKRAGFRKDCSRMKLIAFFLRSVTISLQRYSTLFYTLFWQTLTYSVARMKRRLPATEKNTAVIRHAVETGVLKSATSSNVTVYPSNAECCTRPIFWRLQSSRRVKFIDGHVNSEVFWRVRDNQWVNTVEDTLWRCRGRRRQVSVGNR